MHVRALALIGVAGLVGGCASSQYSQQLNQLKSDVGLLDQRVSQLERVSVTPSPSAELPAEPQGPSSASSAPTTAEASPASTPRLKPSKKEIQQALKNAGFYHGTIDGKLGPKTREAIKEFQRANGLKADGVIGRQTWDTLAPSLEKVPHPSAPSGNDAAAEPVK